MTPRVALSALTLVPGLSGGTESYLRQLCRGLASAGELEYHVFTSTLAPDAGETLPTQVVSAYRASWTIPGRLQSMIAGSLFPGRISASIDRFRPSVVHFPLTIHVPRLRRRVPIVTTLHDLQHVAMPELFSRPELFYRKLAYRDAVRRSDCVIAISDHGRQAIVDTLDVEPRRVRRIYFGVDGERFHPGDAPREPFVLYPANRWRHKNHDRLFQAMSIVRSRRPELELVLTGAGHEGKPLPAGVRSLGLVSGERLPELYRSASALVFPSLYEGFGLPVVEAMSSGCPVACANAAALPEIAGGAAELFDPLSPEAIAEAVLNVLGSPEEFSRRGLARAAAFTWSESARQHDAVYREVGAAS